jgi:uncharacterized protein YdeI (YjbR/CyaY-like superfamily)
MEISKTLYVKNREQWREWLEKNYNKEKEIWLIYPRKSSGKERIPYKDCVEEALCYGWIDSIAKGIDSERYCQRFSPRRPNSQLSELNKEHIRRMIKLGKMTPAGLKAVEKQYNPEKDKAESKNLIIASDILEKIKSNKEAWKNFQNFSIGYKRVRISAIEGYRNYQGNNKLFDSKLAYFIKMSAKSKTFGVLRD